MFDAVLKFFLLLTHIVYLKGMSLNNVDAIFFYIASMGLYGASLVDNPVRNLKNKWIIPSIIGCCLLNLFLHNFNLIVLNFSTYVFIGCILFKIIYENVKDVDGCVDFIIIGLCLNILTYCFQCFGFNPVLKTTSLDYPGGIMGNLPRLTTYTALLLPFIWVRSKVLFFLCLGMSFVKEAQYALIACGVVTLFFNLKFRWLKIGLILSSILGGIYFHEKIIDSFSVRFNAWGHVINLLFDHPLQGIGLGVYPFKPVPNVDLVFHSSHIQIIAGGGVLAFILLCYLYREYFKNFNLSPYCLSVLNLFLISFIEYPVEIKRLWVTGISILAFNSINSKKKDLVYE